MKFWNEEKWGDRSLYVIEWTWKPADNRIQIYYADDSVEQFYLTLKLSQVDLHEYVDKKISMHRIKEDNDRGPIPDLKITINY